MSGVSTVGRFAPGEPDWKAIAAAWTPPPLGVGYRTGVALAVVCALLMILILLVILASLIGAAAAFYMSVQPGFVHASVAGRGTLILWIVYLLPGVLAAVLVASLLRPMFVRLGIDDDAGNELDRRAEPELYGFVDNICNVLNAPRPERIKICSDANASALFRGGLFSLFGPPRLHLVLGAPLVATLTRAQLAGIIAHEVGHFAQHRSTRVRYLAGRVTYWFLMAGYGETPGHRLAAQARDEDSLLSNLFGLTVLALVTIMQWTYRGIAMVGVAVGSNLSRQKEFDADAYKAFLVGSKIAEATLEVSAPLARAHHAVMMFGLGMFQGRRELPANAPQVAARFYRGMSPELREESARIRHRERTRWDASHPSLGDRVAALRKLDRPGVYSDTRPAATLFVDFTGVARQASYATFRPVLGADIRHATFVGVRMNSSGRMELQDDDSTPEFGVVSQPSGPVTLSRVPLHERIADRVGFAVPMNRPLFLRLTRIASIDDHRSIASRITALTRTLRERVPPAASAVAAFRAASSEERAYRCAAKMLAAGVPVDLSALGYAPSSRSGCVDRADAASRAIEATLEHIDSALDAFAQRVSAVLSLLGVDGIERNLRDLASVRERVELLLAAHSMLRQVYPLADEVDREMLQWRMLAEAVGTRRDREPAKVARRQVADRVRELLESVRSLSGATIDPTSGEPGDGRRRINMTNLGHSLIGATPAWRDYGAIAAAGSDFPSSWHMIHREVLFELLEIADEIERAVTKPAAKPVSP